MYVRTGYNAKIMKDYVSDSGAAVEYMFIKIKLNAIVLIIGNVYAPDGLSVAFMEHFRSILSELSSIYSDILVMGDFNTNLHDSESENLLTMIDSLSFKIVPSFATRHDRHRRSTLIDLIFGNNTDRINNLIQASLGGLTDHDFLCIDYKVKNAPIPVTFTRKRFDQVLVPNLLAAAQNLNWATSSTSSPVNEQVLHFNECVTTLIDRHVPIKTTTIADLNSTWMTMDVHEALKVRSEYFANWKLLRTDESWLDFKRVRNKTTAIVRKARRKHVYSQLDIRLSSKKLWSNIKNLGLVSESPESNSDFPVDELNKQFAFASSSLLTSYTPTSFNEGLETHQTSQKFSFRTVNDDEVSTAIKSISSDAIGSDEIPLSFIKILLPVILSHITQIFNNIISTSTFPDVWKLAKVKPIPKVPSPNSANDFRPISLLPAISKAFERIIHDQLSEFFDRNSLFNPLQSGFRKKSSTTTALTKIVDDIRCGMDRGMITVLVLLDFSKAFDTIINHILLCRKLEKYNLEDNAVEMILSYLSGRSQYVENGDAKSERLSLRNGVPQGSIMGPLLFSIFINDLPDCVSFSTYHLFADDFQIYKSDRIGNAQQIISNINEDLARILEWSKCNGLKLNASKTQAIIFHHKVIAAERIAEVPSIRLDDQDIPYSSTVKNLGLFMDSHLDWMSNAAAVCKKVYYGLHSLNRMRFYTPQNIRLQLVKSLILPHFQYCDVIFSSASRGVLQKLRLAFNACLRYVHNLRRFDHISHLESSLFGCSFEKFYKYRIACSVFKVLHGMSPNYMNNFFVRGSFSRTDNLLMPRFRTECFGSSFRMEGVRVWNSLPASITSLERISAFKTEALQYFSNS